jgi:hypothetical protein
VVVKTVPSGPRPMSRAASHGLYRYSTGQAAAWRCEETTTNDEYTP